MEYGARDRTVATEASPRMSQEPKRPPTAQERALRLLSDAEAQLAGLGDDVAGGLSILRAMIGPYVEMGGMGQTGRIVASLYTVVGDLLKSQRYDREAVEVHLQAWRLVLTNDLDEDTTQTLFAGLKSVRDFYADQKAA